MGTIQTQEPRTFEQRFGPRCPFCNARWSDERRCDPNPPDRSYQDGFRIIFAKPTFQRQCVVCDAAFTSDIANKSVCSDPCRVIRDRLMWKDRRARYLERRRARR